jgi:hypothetical protein
MAACSTTAPAQRTSSDPLLECLDRSHLTGKIRSGRIASTKLRPPIRAAARISRIARLRRSSGRLRPYVKPLSTSVFIEPLLHPLKCAGPARETRSEVSAVPAPAEDLFVGSSAERAQCEVILRRTCEELLLRVAVVGEAHLVFRSRADYDRKPETSNK